MSILLRTWYILTLFFMVSVSVISGPVMSAAQEPGEVKSYYSPIVRIEAEKGFFLITTGSGILWIQVAEEVKSHLQTLSLGDMIDVVIQFRPDNLPPILVSWKLARSESPCKIYDGKSCRKE